MEVVILADPAAVGSHTAELVARRAAETPDMVLGIATGSSPLGTYRELARLHAQGDVTFDGVRCFALDEYVGLPERHPASYALVVERELTTPLGLDPANVRTPDGSAADIQQACLDYEHALAASGGVDLQILGIGTNGHIGFNEPTSSLASRTRVKALSQQTRMDNARFFAKGEDVPTHCITQGLGTIMEAREIVLVAQGEAKAAAVAAAIEGPVSSMCPASLLQFHPRTRIVLDEAAASGLTLADYHRFVAEAKHHFPGGTR
ncbi:glucosamine-6-phosphate deaminase [Nesterenkonia lutea]|uniref:Glucosamine-6-phosphate deaminase n=1 Tax=Nesterenkonia lutea TaxID=272919 RepID=A0ABR9JGS2_9MICC|nr:glucosamine-6-phosphate deaminase [Nesterenkonia lutea]MBE1524667.1 glucosamine-6-phosphate deaminase [Nesterenkonia lutea]